MSFKRHSDGVLVWIGMNTDWYGLDWYGVGRSVHFRLRGLPYRGADGYQQIIVRIRLNSKAHAACLLCFLFICCSGICSGAPPISFPMPLAMPSNP